MVLLCNGEFRYSELEKGLPKISPRKLSKELKDLETNKLVERKGDLQIKRLWVSPCAINYRIDEFWESS